jgi:hypothetical protein
MRCREHDAGDGEFPCPWPVCREGTPDDRLTFGRVTYRRMRNITDGRVWWTWQLAPRGATPPSC